MAVAAAQIVGLGINQKKKMCHLQFILEREQTGRNGFRSHARLRNMYTFIMQPPERVFSPRAAALNT